MTMRINGNIDVPDDAIAEFCRKWKITEFSLFGSVLRDDFTADSDIDVLVRFEAGARWDLWDVPNMQEELVVIFGRKVDLADKDAVERSRNPFRKRAVLKGSRLVYARE
jgi:predicted nucleotidyltransferase